MTTLDEARTGAYRLAQSAALRDTGVQACPYPDGGTSVQAQCRRSWLHAYQQYRGGSTPPAEKDDAGAPDSADGEAP